MGISDEIKIVTIIIDEVIIIILRDLSDNYITISIMFDTFSQAMTVKKPVKKCAVCTFSFFSFLSPMSVC